MLSQIEDVIKSNTKNIEESSLVDFEDLLNGKEVENKN